jgi:uncharacterized phiE125 gp8 family phage protein
MKSNRILSVSITETVPVTEPVTIDQAKAWLIVEHTDHDTLITELTKAVRLMVERRTKKKLVPSVAVIELIATKPFTLPRLPLTSFTKLEYWDCTTNAYVEVTDTTKWRIIGPVVYSDILGQLRITYNVGYALTGFPEDLRLAMKSEICYRYENRGDKTVDSDLSSSAESYLSNFISYAWQ